jgi:hypothetical protein
MILDKVASAGYDVGSAVLIVGAVAVTLALLGYFAFVNKP